MQGVGSIMGGVIIMHAATGGVDRIFTEINFGDFPSNEEVIELSNATLVFVDMMLTESLSYCRLLPLANLQHSSQSSN